MECLHSSTLVYTTEHGLVEIQKLYELYGNTNRKFHVYSYDHQNKRVVVDEVCKVWPTKKDVTYKINFDDGGFGRITYRNAQTTPMYINMMPNIASVRSVSVVSLDRMTGVESFDMYSDCSAEYFICIIMMFLIVYVLYCYLMAEKK